MSIPAFITDPNTHPDVVKRWEERQRFLNRFRNAKRRAASRAAKEPPQMDTDEFLSGALQVDIRALRDSCAFEPLPTQKERREEYFFTRLSKLEQYQAMGETDKILHDALTLHRQFAGDSTNLGHRARVSVEEHLLHLRHIPSKETIRRWHAVITERLRLGDYVMAAWNAIAAAEYHRHHILADFNRHFNRSWSYARDAITFANRVSPLNPHYCLAQLARQQAEAIIMRLYNDYNPNPDARSSKWVKDAEQGLTAVTEKLCGLTNDKRVQACVQIERETELARRFIGLQDKDGVERHVGEMLRLAEQLPELYKSPQTRTLWLQPQIRRDLLTYKLEGAREKTTQYHAHLIAFQTCGQTGVYTGLRATLHERLRRALSPEELSKLLPPVPPCSAIHLYHPVRYWAAGAIS